jgi:hypothetical protein
VKISRQEGSILGFKGCGTGPHIWRPRAPVLTVGKFYPTRARGKGAWPVTAIAPRRAGQRRHARDGRNWHPTPCTRTGAGWAAHIFLIYRVRFIKNYWRT